MFSWILKKQVVPVPVADCLAISLRYLILWSYFSQVVTYPCVRNGIWAISANFNLGHQHKMFKNVLNSTENDNERSETFVNNDYSFDILMRARKMNEILFENYIKKNPSYTRIICLQSRQRLLSPTFSVQIKSQ